MLFGIPFLADWNKIGEYMQHQTDRNTARENKSQVDWDYKVGGKVLIRRDGVLRKGETKYQTNGTIRFKAETSQKGFKSVESSLF
jgi:hypothetical protein